MMIAAPTSSSESVEDGGNFSADSQSPPINSDDEQLDDTPFLSHQLPDDQESFSEKFLRNILTHDYQNLMPRRREKFVEITKTVTVTEIVNGAPDKHPSSCEVKVTNISPAGPHPVNVSIKHLHEKWHSCDELDKSDDGGDLGKGTVIRIHETHKPFNYTLKKQQQQPTKFVYEDVVNTKVESSTRSRHSPSSTNNIMFNQSSDNIIDLEFRHPILVETSEKTDQKMNGNNGTRRRFADLRKKISTTTKTSVTETEKVTTTRRSSSAHSTSSRRSYGKPEVQTLYYRKFVDEETKGGDDDTSDSGSVIIHRDTVTRRSRSADHLQQNQSSPTMSPIAPPRKRLGREESLHYYRDDDEVIGEKMETEKKRTVTVKSPEPGNTSVSMNDTVEGRNLTAGITSVSMNDSCTDTSYESRFSTIPRARSSPPGTHRINHIHVNVIGPIRTHEPERRHPVAGRVGDDVTMDIFIERRGSASNSRRGSHVSYGSIGTQDAPPKPPRRSKYEDHIRIGEPIATSTPMTTIERKQTREERVSTESGQSSRKSTRSSRPPDINIIECETFLRETRSPARTPATPIVVINQTPSSRRSSQDLLGEPGQRRRKSTVTDIDWYAAFNMKDPSSPTKLARAPFISHADERKASRDMRRRASDSSMIGVPPADIDLNQIFSCTAPPEIKKDEKCQCNACRLIRMSEAERAMRIERATRSRNSRSFTRTSVYETRSNTLPSRHRTSPVDIQLEDIFNPKPSPPVTSKPPTPPNRRRHAPTPVAPSQSSIVDESPTRHLVTTSIDRKQVTPVTITTTNSRDSGPQLHENSRNRLLKSSDDWVGQMMNDANEWENIVTSRKSSVLSTSSSTARKISVARRISVDELTKPEKRKSREAVPLPPSDVSIDDIFTALTPKKGDVVNETGKKTFIVTRKQRAQDVDAIDFENNRKTPVAPPRSKNAGTAESSEDIITLTNKKEDRDIPSEVSTATINLEDVFARDDSFEKNPKINDEDEKIRKRVAEFTKVQQEKEMSAEEKYIGSSIHKRVMDISNISMDDVFNPSEKSFEVEIPYSEPQVTSTASIQMKPSETSDENHQHSDELPRSKEEDFSTPIKTTSVTAPEIGEKEKKVDRTSAVNIDLDKVFVCGSAKNTENDESDEKIKRGIAEFERSMQEKEAQRTGIVVSSYSSKKIFDESDISMDDIFNTSQNEQIGHSSLEIKKPDQTETTTIILSQKPKKVSSANISLDDVFVPGGDSKKSTKEDDEDDHIRKRINEFKRTTEEKESQKTIESHSSRRVFGESDISMDDVFNQGSKNAELMVSYAKPEETSTASIIMKSAKTEYHVSPTATDQNQEVNRASSVSIDFNKVFVQEAAKNTKNDDSDEKIQRGIAEFERSQKEKEIQRSGVDKPYHSISRKFFYESNISMEEVFNSENKNFNVEIEIKKPSLTSTASTSMASSEQKEDSPSIKHSPVTAPKEDIEKRVSRTSDVSIDLEKVFAQGAVQNTEKDETDEKIKLRIAEFEKSKQEKEAQRTETSSNVRVNEKTLDESNISMDDVFNSQSQKAGVKITFEEPEIGPTVSEQMTISENVEATPSIVGLTSKISDPKKSSDEILYGGINLNNVFVQNSLENSKIAQNDERTQQRIAEFEKSKIEKESQKTVAVKETHSNRRILDESNISLEDVFSTSNNVQKPHSESQFLFESSDNVEKQKDQNEISVPSTNKVFEGSNISMDDVFGSPTSEMDKSKDKMNITTLFVKPDHPTFVVTTDKDETTKTITTTRNETETDTTSRRVYESAISMDDIFKSAASSNNVISTESVLIDENETGKTTSPITSKDELYSKDNEQVTSTMGIHLDDVFVKGSAENTNKDEQDKKLQKGISEFEKTKKEKESQRSLVSETSYSSRIVSDDSNISLDDVFNTKSKTEEDNDFLQKLDVTATSTIRMRPFEEQKTQLSMDVTGEDKNSDQYQERSLVSTSTFNLDDVFAQRSSERLKNVIEDDKIKQGTSEETTPSTSSKREDHKKKVDRASAVSIDLEKIFVRGSAKNTESDDSDEKIKRGIAEFERSMQEKEAQRTGIVVSSYSSKKIFDESDISMDEIFNTSQNEQIRHPSLEIKKPDQTETITTVLSQEPKEASSNISLDDVFVLEGASKNSKKEDDEDEHIRKRMNEFKRTTEEKESQRTIEPHSSRRVFDESRISMDEIFNTSATSNREDVEGKPPREQVSQNPAFETSAISLEDIFNKTADSGFEKTTSDFEKTTTTTTTRTETTTDSYSKTSAITLDDLFGPQTATPPIISVSAISFDQPSSSPIAPPRKHQNLSSLMVPGKWNESMMSNASTISLDDSFNNSLAKSGYSQAYEAKMRKPLTLPVDNWIDNLVETVTDEATKEAPKTPKSATGNYFRSPTRISQEIKYEWIAKLIEDDGERHSEAGREENKGHQSEEEHLQKQDNTWISSVVYRPTLESSAYTLKSNQMKQPKTQTEIDINRVFDECLLKKNKDDEKCECSACRLTEQELEEIEKRKIEISKMTREEKQSERNEPERHRNVSVLNPSEFSIDDVFNPDVPLTVQTDNTEAPSTSSPPLQPTRTYYISPKVSETVTTIHQWKDADISMDEIFSPVSSTTNENRRFSNFYEDRSGWDTIGSEDSGVMSGGDRGRRQSTRITDHVIDEAFKGIFDVQPTTSSEITKPEHSETQYDDYYITSLHHEDVDGTDSEVDGDNLDVSQFVDDILGKSLDEAAFLSSAKSLRDHTDTSIDRKKSGEKVHPYYRTRTDTSIDKRSKPEVINEDLETADTQTHDEIMRLVFVNPSDPSISKSDSRRSISLSRNKSITKPSDEELLEIEIQPDYFLIKGSYSLLISKSDPLGHMLQKLREQNDSLATLDFSLTRKLKKLLVSCIRERAGCLDMTSTSSKYEGLSSRGQSLIESIDHASATFLKMNVDKYEPTRNPSGVVNFCTAENNICTPLLEERFKHLELFFPNTEHLVRYPPAGGWPEAREVLVKYFKEFLGARVTIDELVLTASTRTGYDVTSYCLFEQDDILLTNGPVYTGTISNVQEKAQCQVACVETDLSNPRLDVKMYEEELNRQTALDNNVAGVIIVNPHNPLGVTFPPEEVVNLCNWAASRNLQVVIDEVFANCVFDKSNSKFRPFLSYRHRVHHPENVAWLWSVSKDFGLPGLKFAVIHSANEGLRQAATKLQMYYPCSPFVQDFAVNLLSNSEWLREFHTEVNRRIAIHYRYTAENLNRLEIPFVPAQAGIFVFADFSKHLTSIDDVGELELFERLASKGVMLTPGVHQKCHLFGWFRIVFACTKEELEEGFRRLYTYLGSHLHPVGTVQYDN